MDTATQAAEPEQILSRILQELRDAEVLYFSETGEYVLIDTPIKVEDEDFADDVLDAAITQGKLLIGDIPTSDEFTLARRRRGQDRLRKHILNNYRQQCALCDVTDERLLVTSHIIRWADAPELRGNLANVICLCRFHDALFETGYISLAGDLQVLKKDNGGSTTIEINLTTAIRFRLPESHAPSPEYLKKHRQRSGFGS
ncbi:MAG TPA: HNH endonuclease signature motif containing protein [Blastocatellia bacterium]|jgi:hypothetical protein|nr:HNH endonuclease signature motif containing protein [Blastocatellia bacterium]